MTKDRWQRKADALIRLADDQRGKPEGDLAREKLLQIINKHPESFTYQPLIDFAEREFTLGHLREMRQQGISTNGRWTANTLDEAIDMMVADYKRRLWDRRVDKLDQELFEIEQRIGNNSSTQQERKVGYWTLYRCDWCEEQTFGDDYANEKCPSCGMGYFRYFAPELTVTDDTATANPS